MLNSSAGSGKEFDPLSLQQKAAGKDGAIAGQMIRPASSVDTGEV